MICKLEKRYFSIKQNNFIMYLMKITVGELLNNTFVELYDHNSGDGYQRKLVPDHYRKIARFLLESNNSVMPSSIICAIDRNDVEINEDVISFREKLRIVDGQHRREGFRYYIENYNQESSQILNYELPMIVLVIENEDDKLVEVETFVNINSKAKPVKTDLAVELREKLRRKNSFEFKSKVDFVESVATSVAKLCNDKKGHPWENNIKMAEDRAQKPVGLNTFKKALNPVVSAYMIIKNIDYKHIQRDDYLYDNIVYEIGTILIEAWKVVYKKWPVAFENYKDFNIMKSVGVNSINIILANCIKENEDNVLEKFAEIINQSKETSGVWKRGGEFSGLSSEQGFKVIVDRIIKHS